MSAHFLDYSWIDLTLPHARIQIQPQIRLRKEVLVFITLPPHGFGPPETPDAPNPSVNKVKKMSTHSSTSVGSSTAGSTSSSRLSCWSCNKFQGTSSPVSEASETISMSEFVASHYREGKWNVSTCSPGGVSTCSLQMPLHAKKMLRK